MSSSSFVYPNLCVESPNVALVHDDQQQPQLESRYQFDQVRCQSDPQTNSIKATPMRTDITFRTRLLVPRVGVMLVGWGGNNGTTLTGAILANKFNLSFETKEGKVEPNYFGSITQSSTVQLGSTAEGQPMYLPMNKLLPMADPSELFLDGWDISGANLAVAMRRAKVLDVSLQAKLAPLMGQLKPRRAIFDPNFVAENQLERADNILDSTKLTKWQQLEQIRADIQQFKQKFALDKVLVVWTANTERYCELTDCHQSADRLLECLRTNSAECAEVSPSTLYALAAILSGCCYINGSPQNTFVPAVCELAERRAVFIAGDDFKSGQTKIKSVLVDFLVAAGIKPRSIVSYNHLGNNDGYNLSAPKQFRSKEISKSSVVDDMVQSNRLLFPEPQADQPDHCVVIKYVPHVGDSKRALDEYSSELMLGGSNTIVMHNTCEDSLLAAPLIIDLVLLAELCQRVQFSVGPKATIFQPFNSVLSLLAYLCKAPLVERQGGQVVNALFRQRQSIENLLRALVGLPPINNLDLRPKLSLSAQWTERVAPPVDSELNHKLNLVQLSSYLRAKPPVGPTQFQLEPNEAKIQARAAAEDERALTRRIGPEFTSGH